MGASTARLTRSRLLIAFTAVIAAALVAWFLAVPDEAEAEPAYLDPSLPVAERVADLLGRMTIEEKVGQMAQAQIPAVEDDPGAVGDFGLGSLLSGGSEALHDTPEEWAAMIDGYQREALDTRLGIPMVYGIDAVHGNASLPGATIFPHNIGLGAAADPDLAERAAAITAIETRAAGIRWTFAPCLCVARDSRWGRTYESFGEDPALATAMADDVVRGYQGEDLSLNTSVLATAKHYVGDGGTAYGSSTTGSYTIDQGVTELSEEELRRLHLEPFRAAVEAGVGSVMASFSSTDLGDGPLKVHADGHLLTTVLKEELGFEGFVVSDWAAIYQISDDYSTAVREAVNAGIDMVMVPDEYEAFISQLLEEVDAGRVSEDRIDDAVSRILTQKFELGLFEHPFADTSLAAEVGSAEHRAVAREAAAASQVLLRNENALLPLSGEESIYVAGSGADALGRQLGGWSGTWQGSVDAVNEGTTILEGIGEVAPEAAVQYSPTASEPLDGHDVGIVAVAENPYAEGVGDVGPGNAHDMKLSEQDAEAVERVCGAMDCVVIVVSGRPVELEGHLDGVDALVAAWLPGSEGAGVADPLFGHVPYTGTLPVSWPGLVADEPVNVGDADYDPLFAYGFGLRT
ncbi:glycoside hydrolase family 3 protein [Glycomyces tenuis]|uniref:glycoside hydrolase family 3 protein n=1 Tax=Glycomyces tenuis TaxID=58116 RepID=UPI0004047AA2|nr:glycoside hydrolase family 3 protein [Glycomyces tenuis]